MSRRGFDTGMGGEMMLRETVHCQGELKAAPRCIPSARVQPKHLMKSESAVRAEHFHKNNALSVCHTTFPAPLVLPFFSISFFPFPRVIHVRTGVMIWLHL